MPEYAVKLIKKLKRSTDVQYNCAMWVAQYFEAGTETVNIIVQYFGLCKRLYCMEAILNVVQYFAQLRAETYNHIVQTVPARISLSQHVE